LPVAGSNNNKHFVSFVRLAPDVAEPGVVSPLSPSKPPCLTFSLITLKNMVVVSQTVRACTRSQKLGGGTLGSRSV